MTDLLVALVVVLVGAAVGLALLVLLTVVPFVAVLDLAELRGWGTARWGALQVVASLLALAVIGLRAREGVVTAVVALAVGLALAWAPAVAVRLLPPGRAAAVTGARGRHE